MSESLNIMMVSSEVAPYARTGGLGDVVGALPAALRREGHTVKTFLPKYATIDAEANDLHLVVDSIQVPIDGGFGEGSVWANADETTMLVGNGTLFDRNGLYADEFGEYGDNDRRFAFFARAALEACRKIGFKPDVIHCHDWQAGLVPAYLKTVYADDEFFRGTVSVFTIHNLGYQGRFGANTLNVAGLPFDKVYHIDGMEFWGDVSYLKGGVNYAEVVSTVSRKYAEEIQTAEYGHGMDGVLAAQSAKLFGIANGVDYGVWNPKRDKALAKSYDLESLANKQMCKDALLKEVGLPKELSKSPVFGVVTRLTWQKGLDVLIEAIPRLAKKKIGLIVLGDGEAGLEAQISEMAAKFPKRLAFIRGWNEALSHRIYAGADFVVVPSRYEPCGLTQLYAMRYGSIPVVRATGGLDDTVQQWDAKAGTGTGFKFDEASSDALIAAIESAMKAYRSAKQLSGLRANGMSADFSWDRSAHEYDALYRKALERSA